MNRRIHFCFPPIDEQITRNWNRKAPTPWTSKVKGGHTCKNFLHELFSKTEHFVGSFFFYLGKLLKTVYTVSCIAPSAILIWQTAVTVDHHTFLPLTHSCACISRNLVFFLGTISSLSFFFNDKKPIILFQFTYQCYIHKTTILYNVYDVETKRLFLNGTFCYWILARIFDYLNVLI